MDMAGTAVASPGSPPLPPLSGVPTAVVPRPSKSALRSMTVTSACTVVRSMLTMAAGLFSTTEASPQATVVPALARPRFLTLFSRSWKPDASAVPAALTPALPTARAGRAKREAACIARAPGGTLAISAGRARAAYATVEALTRLYPGCRFPVAPVASEPPLAARPPGHRRPNGQGEGDPEGEAGDVGGPGDRDEGRVDVGEHHLQQGPEADQQG